jgi:DDE superfamily endonuclease
VFLDESGASTHMTRNYGRAPGGERVPEGTPQSHWHGVTMLAALTTRGLQSPMTIESPTDGDVFLAYLEQVLCPQLQPGRVVIMDNLSARKWPGYSNSSPPPERVCFTCRLIRPTSTPSSRPGRRSSSSCARPRPAAWRLWRSPSPKPCEPLLPTTLQLGSRIADMVYNNLENALDILLAQHKSRPPRGGLFSAGHGRSLGAAVLQNSLFQLLLALDAVPRPRHRL